MEVKERRPYRSLTARQDTERRYTSSSADSEDGKPNPKSYSSSETLKAFDHDSRMAYGSRVKEMVHHEVDEFSRQGWFSCATLEKTEEEISGKPRYLAAHYQCTRLFIIGTRKPKIPLNLNIGPHL